MGSEREECQSSETPKLRLVALKAVVSPDRSGMITPPIHISASIPFQWEEVPGKPRFSLSLKRTESPLNKGLELPPRLLLLHGQDADSGRGTGRGTGRVHGCSFGGQFCGSFRFEKQQLGAMVLKKRGLIQRDWFCWFGKKSGNREVASAYGTVFPSSLERESENDETVAQLNPPHFWGIIHEGLKQINIPWKTKSKSKHEKE